jgi:hypothetical protein
VTFPSRGVPPPATHNCLSVLAIAITEWKAVRIQNEAPESDIIESLAIASRVVKAGDEAGILHDQSKMDSTKSPLEKMYMYCPAQSLLIEFQ